ncbi:ABC transporter permease [Vreelandella arctica]|uniref:ABC transporter permease n=1 Tax=Vreelandella arctica TaxID=3126499 RepID=UPI00300DF94C
MTSLNSAGQINKPISKNENTPENYWSGVGKRIKNDPVTIIVGAVLAGIFLLAIFAPLITGHDPYQGNVMARLSPVGTEGHWLGTDEVGRDMWARIVYGARLSLLAGIAPVLIALMIGGSLGILAGYTGGITNTLIMRIMDVFYAFPAVLLAVAINGVLGTGLVNTLIALTITFIPPLTRISESVTTQCRSADYVEAAKASGARSITIIRQHILANVIGQILVYATSLISLSIILAAGISFLGLGVSPPAAEWGLMLNNLRQAIWVNPLLAALPGLAIFITSMCFNLLSDGLRSAMDVRL